MLPRFIFLLLTLLAFSPAAEADTVRVITFNIHHAEGDDMKVDLDRIARVITAAQPDIVCLQEIDRNLPRTQHLDFPAILADKLKMTAVFEPNYRFDGGEYGNAILTPHKVLGWKNHPLPNPNNAEPRGCLEVQVSVGERPLTVFNTHLGLKAPEREEQAAAILKLLPSGPHFLAGDLNEVPEGKPLQMLLTKLADTFTADTSGPAKTFSTTVLARRIDYILTSPGITTRASRIINDIEAATASDHLPYTVEIELP